MMDQVRQYVSEEIKHVELHRRVFLRSDVLISELCRVRTSVLNVLDTTGTVSLREHRTSTRTSLRPLNKVNDEN